MNEQLDCIVLCGGAGNRLWPLSTDAMPKYLIDPVGSGRLIDQTIQRLDRLQISKTPSFNTRITLVGSVSGAAPLIELSSKIKSDLLLEPTRRNTAAAVAVACLHGQRLHADDALLLICPSDHIIGDQEAFSADVAMAVERARQGNIILFGIKPDRPATGFGYFQTENNSAPSRISRFIEKPTEAIAKDLLSDASKPAVFWNSGMVLARRDVLIDAFQTHAPQLLALASRAVEQARQEPRIWYLDTNSYEAMPSLPFDTAVLEKSETLCAIPASFDWDDLGDFHSLWRISERDESGNVIHGPVDMQNSSDVFAKSNGTPVRIIGLQDASVVVAENGVLVTAMNEAQAVRPANTTELPKSVGSDWVYSWLKNDVLPLWADVGIDHVNGGFEETLSLTGQPLAADRRLRTMARQVFVFARAVNLGWGDIAEPAMQKGLAFLNSRDNRSISGHWSRSFDAKNMPLDTSMDTYSHAFVLLAYAEAHKTGLVDCSQQAKEIFRLLDRYALFGEVEQWNGFAEGSVAKPMRRSNPHMHLLEACLAWYEATGKSDALDRAERIIGLFDLAFYERDTLVLQEEFDHNLSAAQPYFEPGHHFEWTSLLGRFAKAKGISPHPAMRELYAAASTFGTNQKTGMAYDRVGADGTPIATTSRCWPQAEKLKAGIALSRQGLNHLDGQIENSITLIERYFISPAGKGLWNDKCDENGNPISHDVPASTLYHLIDAFSDYLEYRDTDLE